MKRIKTIILLIIVMFTCSCVKNESIMTIGADKSMNFEINLGYIIDSDKEIDMVKLKDNVAPLGFFVDSYHDNKYNGYKLSKKYDNINKISSKEATTVDLTNIINGKFNENNLFKVKKGFFKNTYTANFKYDFKKLYNYKFKLYIYGEDTLEAYNNAYNYLKEFIEKNNYDIEIIKYNVLSNLENFNSMKNVLESIETNYAGLPVIIFGNNYYNLNEIDINSMTNDIKKIINDENNYKDIVSNDYNKEYELTYTVNLPNESITNNATQISSNKKTLKWNLSYFKENEIQYSFSIFNSSSIVIIVVFILSLLIISFITMILYTKYRKDKERFIAKNTNLNINIPENENNQIMSVSDLMKK